MNNCTKISIFLLVVLMLVVLVVACASTTVAKEQESPRFTGDVGFVRDTKFGCEYIRTGGYSSWTYVHGSCPDIIAKENGRE